MFLSEENLPKSSQYRTFCDSFTSVCEIVLCILHFFMSLPLLYISKKKNNIKQNLSRKVSATTTAEMKLEQYNTFCLWSKRKRVLYCFEFAWLWFVFIDPYWHVEVCCGVLLCQREQISEATSYWWPDPLEGCPSHSSLCSAKKRRLSQGIYTFSAALPNSTH